nr:uncharacterized protein LOC129163481 [Nothobranchius furzeri]
MDVVALSWLTCLCNIAWSSGAVSVEWQTGVVVLILKKGGLRVCSNYRGITLLSLPGKVYSKVLERRVRSIVESPVRVGLRQACPLSPVPFITFMDRISRCSYGVECVEFGGRRISSLLFADDVVLLASSSSDLQLLLGRFTAECEAAGMRISTSKSETMVLDRKRVACQLRVGGEVLPQVEEFKYLGFLFTSEGRTDQDIDKRIGSMSAVMRTLSRSVVPPTAPTGRAQNPATRDPGATSPTGVSQTLYIVYPATSSDQRVISSSLLYQTEYLEEETILP